MKRNTHREMVEEFLGADPVEFSLGKRAEGMTLQQIAREIFLATDGKVDVSFSTVRNWLNGQNGEGDAA